MPITTAPALLIGLGARILLDYYSRSDGPFVKDFILAGAWQGVALHYATKTSKSSVVGIIVGLGIVVKLSIDINFGSDLTRGVMTILGIGLGILFTDFLSQYFDKPSRSSSSERRKRQKKLTSGKALTKQLHDRTVRFRPSAQAGSVETVADITEITDYAGTLVTTSHRISDITSVDSNSDKMGPTSFMSPLDREVHLLRTRAALADSERRRFKEERKWAISQGNMARAEQMKWEVKRYTSLMQTFNREADIKSTEAASPNGTVHDSAEVKERRATSSSSREKATRPSSKKSAESQGPG